MTVSNPCWIKTNFFKKNTDLKFLNVSVYYYKSYILNKGLLFIHQRILKKVSEVSNIDNKSALHKMHFKLYYNFDQINAVFFSEKS